MRATPGEPTASTELARELKPSAARSTQSPSRSVSTAGQPARARRSASSGETRWRTDGRGGTGLPETMSARGIVTAVPSAGCTVVVVSVQAVISPSRSVIAGPPDGPVSPRTTRRTTTLCPTQCGPRPGAVGEGTGAPFVWWAGGFIGPTTH